MSSQELPSDAKEILDEATPEQVKWVLARLACKTDQDAARVAGVHPSTVSKWANKEGLDRAVNVLLRAPVVAAVQILEGGVARAAQVLVDALDQKGRQMEAANNILDRMGVTGAKRLDVTSGGQTIRVIGGIGVDDV